MVSQNILLLSSLLLLLLLNLGYASNGPIPGSMKAQKQENMSSPGFSMWEPSELYFPKKPLLYRCLYGCLPPPNITYPKKHHHHHHHPSPSPSPSPLNQRHHHRPPHQHHPSPHHRRHQPKPMQKGKQDGH
ncbi:hypothetical protein AABB24_016798 [Solanum stoloniferum]|uniref:Transmembrane protein n=1 Tax=Solanum stoloniferum TaxID=62892 RepID=A0ABD2TJT8_9SOLN